jgi:hypothetical protein
MTYQHAANGLNQAQMQQTAAPPPRTIASAMSRVDGLNERLIQMRGHLSNICEQIGGPYPASAAIGKERAASPGAVGRLNDSVDAAHDCVAEIESLLQSISRSLG